MSARYSDRYVYLRGGLCVPVEPLQLLLNLEARGFQLGPKDNDQIWEPAPVSACKWKRRNLAGRGIWRLPRLGAAGPLGPESDALEVTARPPRMKTSRSYQRSLRNRPE